MSPRYLGGKYSSRLQPWSGKCSRQCLGKTECVKSSCTRPASSASRGDNKVDLAMCLKAEFQMPTDHPNEKVLHNYDISVLQQVGIFFNGIACLVNFAFDVTSQIKQIDQHWFQWCQMCFWWMWWTTSWKYFIIYPVRLFGATSF